MTFFTLNAFWNVAVIYIYAQSITALRELAQIRPMDVDQRTLGTKSRVSRNLAMQSEVLQRRVT